jgi:hypothetical protein
MKKILFITLLFFALFAGDVLAGKRYWISGVTSNWNNIANWSLTTAGAGGETVPGNNDTAYFDGGGTGQCNIDAIVNIKRLEMAAGCGTIVQSTFAVTIGTSGAVLAGGTFTGGSGTITLTGAMTISGCAFTSTSGTLTTNSNFTLSGTGTFTHNSGKVRFTATSTISGSMTMYQLEFAPATTSTYTIASGTTLTVMNTLTVSSNGAATLNTGNIHAKGNLLFSNTSNGGGGSATITINGGGTQTFTGNATEADGQTPNIVINKVSTDTLKLVSIISSDGDWTWTSGIVAAGFSTVYFIGSHTVSGTHALFNVTKTSGTTWTINSGDTLIVNGTFKVVNANNLTMNSGVLRANGNIDISDYTGSTGGGGTATLYIAGSTSQTFTGTPAAGQGRLPNIKINKSGGAVSLSGFIFCAGDWTYTDGMVGSLSAGTSTVQFRVAGCDITGTHTLSNVVFYGDVAITYTISGTLTTTGTLSFNGSNTLTLSGGTIHAQGDITTSNTGTSTGGTTSIVINGSGPQVLTGSGTAGAGSLPGITISKSGGTLSMISVISLAGNWEYTAGTVSPGTSAVALYGNFNLDGQGTSATMSFYRLAVMTGTRTLTGNVDANDNFTIASGATCVGGSYSIAVGGNWNSQGTWTYGSSTVTFDGGGYTRIQGASGATVNFASVVINRRSAPGSLKLSNPVQINTAMTLSLGRIITDTVRYLAFVNDATCTVTNDDSAYVCGPVRKTGNDAFSFPLGDTLLPDSVAYHPLTMTAPSTTGDQFQAIYRAVGQSYGSAKEDTLVSISNCEYWTFQRRSGSSNVAVGVGWNKNSCQVDEYNDLRLAGWDGTQWEDLGNVTVTVDGDKGQVTLLSSFTLSQNPQPIVIGKKKTSTPYAVLQTVLTGGYHTVYNGKLLFKYDELYNETGNLRYTIYDDYHRPVASNIISPGVLTNGTVVTGDNRYLLNLLDCDITVNGALSSGMFLLEVINDKGEIRYLLIKHITTIAPLCPDSNPPE